MLNSTNRISSICAEVVEARIAHEAAELAALEEAKMLEEQIEEAHQFIENSEASELFTSLAETAIQISENDANLFDVMIELDFVSSMKHSLGSVNEEYENGANDAKKASIKKNINKVCNATVEAIKSAGVHADKSTDKVFKNIKYDEYSKVLKDAKSEDFKNLSTTVYIPSAEADKLVESVADMSDIVKMFKKCSDGIKNGKTIDDVDDATNDCIDDFKAVKSNFKDTAKKVSANNIAVNINKEAIAKIVSKASGNSIKRACAYTTTKAIDEINKISKIALACVEATDKDSSEFAVYKINLLYIFVSKAVKLVLRKYNMYLNLVAREAASYRKAFVICGKYAARVQKNVSESVDDIELSNMIFAEASDLFVFETYGLM